MTQVLLNTLLILDSDVAGDLGDGTVIEHVDGHQDRQANYPSVRVLDYRMDFWREDEVLTAHPCHIITRSLYEHLRSSGMTGLAEAPVRISFSEAFHECSVSTSVPDFVWLVPTGRVHVTHRRLAFSKPFKEPEWTGHDVCLGPNAELIVTQRAAHAIGIHRMPNCTVTPIVARTIE